MSILTFIYVAAAVVILFGASIFVHEFGHFWMALRRGMKVEEFAIWCGPKLFSWKRNGILYSWRMFPGPIGGFVKLPQMITSEVVEGKSDSSEPLPPVSPLSKILVAFAGPVMNIVFAFAIATVVYFTGLPIPVNPSIIGYVEPGSPEAKLGIQEGDRIVSVDNHPVQSWQDVSTYTILALTNVIPVTIEHQRVQKTYHLTATVNESVGLKLLNLDPRDHPDVMEVEKNSAAEKAGLKVGDEIISFNSIPIVSRDQFIDMVRKRGALSTELRVQRGKEKVTLSVVPQEDPTTKISRIGAALGTSSTQVYMVQKPGPTPWSQVMEQVTRTIQTVSALVHTKQTGVGAKDLTGPVGILSILAAQVKTDYRLALSFLVLLNVNLGILNLLPIPVLDGGHIIMAIVEKIRRRPLSVRFVEYTTMAFFVLIITFMLYVTVFDVKRFTLFRSMFSAKSQIEQPQNGSAAPDQ